MVGRQALEIVKEQFRPEIAILDLGLPDLSGYDLARLLRQDPELQRITLVALTGWGQEEDRRRSQEAGFDTHMVKPVPPGELMRLIANHAGASTRADVGRPEPGRSPASG